MTTWTNYDEVLQQLRDFGLIVSGIDTGKMKRCKVEGDREQRGWYMLHELRLDEGDTVLVGSYGIWRGNENNAQKIELTARKLSDDQRAALKKRWADDKKRCDAERKREADKAAARAKQVWDKLATAGSCQYLEAKGVQAHGLRFSDTNCAYIPMLDTNGGIHGLQILLPKGHPRITKTQRNKDFWPTGLVKKGHFFQIGVIRDIVLIAEGYATAASLYEATQLPVIIAFDAGNIVPVCESIKKRHKTAKILICADDDFKSEGNPGMTAASAAALLVHGAVIAPTFSIEREVGKKGLTDFNDLHLGEGLHTVRSQIEARLDELKWVAVAQPRAGVKPQGGGEIEAMASLLTVDEAAARFWGTYGLGGKVLFDEVECRLVHRDDVMNLLPDRAWGDLKRHPDWRVARDTEIGFDPTEADKQIRCNLFSGWPTVPKQGRCDVLLSLLEYLCSNDSNGHEVYQWVLKWLAYPLQHRGAKMHSAIVVHGRQGTGKSRFFEAYAEIFGEYARVLGQEALEDKFNSDWSEKKLFILADEVLARQDMYHIKNRLKGFITGGTIRVNPKGVAAHNEKNQMNIVFLSNERLPLVLENDDRRHCVIWVPPKLDAEFFTAINDEIDNGGVAALHHFLLNLDLGDFQPWTNPPMTKAKAELIEESLSSEERFIGEWMRGELESIDGEALPFCPCLGSHLYIIYERWCERNGERKRGIKDLISLCGKMNGWVAGVPSSTFLNLKDRAIKSRKMIIPNEAELQASLKNGNSIIQQRIQREKFDSKTQWLTACFFEFGNASGLIE